MKIVSEVQNGFTYIRGVGNKEYILNFLDEMVGNYDKRELIRQSYGE